MLFFTALCRAGLAGSCAFFSAFAEADLAFDEEDG